MSMISRREITKNVGAVLSGTTIARFLSAITTIIIARQIGPDSFGQYSPALSFATLTAIFFVLGLDAWLLRSESRQPAYLSKIGTSALVIEGGLGLLWFVAIWSITPYLNPDTYPVTLVMLAALSVWLEKVARTIRHLFSSALKNEIAMPLDIALHLFFLIMTCGLVLMGSHNVRDYLLVRVIALTLACSLSLLAMKRTFGFTLDWSQLPQTLRETLLFGMSAGLGVIYGRADITIIGQWMGKEAASQYAPASMLAMTMFLVPAAVYTVAAPILSQAYAAGGTLVQQTSVKLIIGTTLVGTFFGFVIALIANPLIHLIYGEAYRAAGDVLAILAWVPALKFVGFACAATIVAVGWQNKRVIIQAMTALLNVGLTLAVVKSQGIIGVAYVYVFSEAFLTMGYLLLVWLWHREQKHNNRKLRA